MRSSREIPDDILAQLEESLLHDQGQTQAHVKAECERLNGRLTQIRHRLEQAYIDKLDGRITEAFWEAKSTEWGKEEQTILTRLRDLELKNPTGTLDAVRILELANKAYFLYFRQPAAEKAKLLRMVLSNCKIDDLNAYPVYKKPFDVIFKRVQSEEWLPGLDSN